MLNLYASVRINKLDINRTASIQTDYYLAAKGFLSTREFITELSITELLITKIFYTYI